MRPILRNDIVLPTIPMPRLSFDRHHLISFDHLQFPQIKFPFFGSKWLKNTTRHGNNHIPVNGWNGDDVYLDCEIKVKITKSYGTKQNSKPCFSCTILPPI